MAGELVDDLFREGLGTCLRQNHVIAITIDKKFLNSSLYAFQGRIFWTLCVFGIAYTALRNDNTTHISFQEKNNGSHCIDHDVGAQNIPPRQMDILCGLLI